VTALLHQRSALASASTQLHQLHTQDAALAQERKNLSASAEISRIAREQYQLVSPGQQPFAVLPPSGTSAANKTYPGDPANQAPVAPSAAVELPPGGTAATTSPQSANAGPGKGQSTGSQSTLTRMLHALEFWR
jgi:hypothetical protein